MGLHEGNNSHTPFPPGALVGILEERLYVHATGEGYAAVVLETGTGGTTLVWHYIQQELSKFARVISYDRPGLGWSEPWKDRYDASSIVRKLHQILKMLEEPGPYIVVGHSLGAFFSRLFYAKYPKEVMGMVLIDPGHDDQFSENSLYPKEVVEAYKLTNELLQNAPSLVARGNRSPIALLKRYGPGLPEDVLQKLYQVYASQEHLQGLSIEAAMWDEIAQQTKASGSLNDLPLIVLSSQDASSQVKEASQKMKEDIAKLSSRGVHRLIPGDHSSVITNPVHSQAVITAIKEMIDQTSKN